MNGLSRPMLIALIVTLTITAWTAFKGGSDSSEAAIEVNEERSRAVVNDTANAAGRPPQLAARGKSLAKTPALINGASIVKLDLFTLRDWAPPPPKVKPLPPGPPPPPPPPPQAPPLESQFEVIGRLSSGDEMIVYVSFQGATLVIGTGPRREEQLGVGDTIGGQYRIDGLSSTQMHLTYLPFNQTQTLRLGD